jgi:hypothetical protein
MSGLGDFFSIIQVMAAGLLVVAGVAKLRSPAATRTVLLQMGLPEVKVLTGAIGAFEIALGVTALVSDARPVTIAVGLVFAIFAGVSLWLWRSGDLASCGCLGATVSPPGIVHFAITTALAVLVLVAGFGLAGETQSALELITPITATTMATAIALAGTVYSLAIAMAYLPDALTAWHKRVGAPEVRQAGAAALQITQRRNGDVREARP